MPRTRSQQLTPGDEPNAQVRVGRVNQRLIDRMAELRRQGFSHREIGKRLGCSERTVRRHTTGVVPQLVHVSDPTGVDLLNWCSDRLFAIKDRLKLSVREIDVVLKEAREAIPTLDELTVQRLELDPKMRFDFWLHDIWPAAAREIGSMRLIERFEAEFGPLQNEDEATE